MKHNTQLPVRLSRAAQDVIKYNIRRGFWGLVGTCPECGYRCDVILNIYLVTMIRCRRCAWDDQVAKQRELLTIIQHWKRQARKLYK